MLGHIFGDFFHKLIRSPWRAGKQEGSRRIPQDAKDYKKENGAGHKKVFAIGGH
jgi:hypothetical protein